MDGPFPAACLLCGSPGRARTRVDKAHVRWCGRCQLGFTDPPPRFDYATYTDEARRLDLWLSFYRPLVAWVDAMAPPARTWMDFGAGGGELLLAAQERGFQGLGVEIDTVASTMAARRGFSIAQDIGSLPTMELGVASFCHVLEHLDDPGAAIRDAVQRLVRDALVVVVQPNPRGLLPRLFRRRWAGWVPEQHLWHFSIRSMRELMVRQGLQVTAVARSSLYYPLQRNKSLPYNLLGRTAMVIGVGDEFWLAARRTA